tara:strand:- start:101 stop:802 length:702 start_codon:yes stop_codon:yes gene_type:complete
MLLSLKNKYVCLNSPKTGTYYRESVLHTCYEYSFHNECKHSRKRLINQWEPRDNQDIQIKTNSGDGAIRHLNIPQVMEWVTSKNIQIDDDLFWFTFTRNPWDRAVSFYNMHLNWNCKVSGIEHTITSEHFMKFLSQSEFKDYDAQITYIQYNDFKVDFIGKLENMCNDMSYVLDRLNLKNICHLNKNREHQPQWFKLRRYHHLIRKIWTDEIIEYIAEYDRDVIELQKYSFTS